MADKRYAVVLAAFGTTQERNDDFVEQMKTALQQHHVEADIFTAFTSTRMATARQEKGDACNTLSQTLTEISGLGYTHVVVQSLHVAPGMEFDSLREQIEHITSTPKGIKYACAGLPLIHNDASAEQLARVLTDTLPETRKPDEAVVFVGHGTKHPVGMLAYPALQAYLWKQDPNLFVGTLEGSLNADSVLAMLRERRVQKVWLVPLLAHFGTHAHRDIFNGGDSWQKTFEHGGLLCVPVQKALLARPDVVAIWIANAIRCLGELHTAS